jgi:hypothetical protein
MKAIEIEDTAKSQSEVDETFDDALDFDKIVAPASWQAPGDYYQAMPANTRTLVTQVVEEDSKLRRELRGSYFPELVRGGSLICWERANRQYIEKIQQKKLYSGQVVAADATLAKYETLSLVGAQIAVSKVSYQHTTGQIVSNIMHWGRELPRKTTAKEIVEAIRSRGKELKDKLPNVFLYSLALYKERQFLLDSPPSTFKLIQGTVFPYEMLVGSGRQFTMLTCLKLLQDLIDEGNYATIVSKDTHRELLVLGMALDPGEYIVVATGDEVLRTFYDPNSEVKAHYTSTPIPQYGGKSQIEIFEEFKKTYGPKVVQGVVRAHPMSPPYVFYCNKDKLQEAVHTLLADAANTGARGFPLLIDLADQYCSSAFRASEYTNRLNAEFARAAGGSGMYQSERTTRD